MKRKKNKIENRKIRKKKGKIYNLFAQKWRQCCALRRRRRRRCMFVIECIVSGAERAGEGAGDCAVLATLPTTNLMPAATATAAAATATATCQQQRLPPTWGTNISGSSKDDPREWRRGTCAGVSVCIFYALRLLPLPQPVLPLWAVSEIICITFLPATNQRHEKLDGN